MQHLCPEQRQPKERLCPRPSLLQTGTVRMGLFMATCLVSLSACHHRDAIDSTLEWTQHMRGGVIAAQRPPPPGENEPYPHVGLTSTQPPELPSPQARALLTEHLIRDRNLTYRTVAANGTLTPVIPPPPSAAATPAAAAKPSVKPSVLSAQNPDQQDASPTLPAGTSGAIMDAAEAAPPPPSKAALPQHSKRPDAKKPSTTDSVTQGTEGPELAMPEVKESTQKAPVPESALPQIPDGPPSAPAFPGFDVPTDAHLADAPRPNYDLSDPKGTALHFMPQSDQLSSGQDGTLAKLISKTPNGPFYVRGFGNSPSLSTQDQADAVQLGLLRAQRVAKELISRNVPASAIHIRGDAFGTGARVASSP